MGVSFPYFCEAIHFTKTPSDVPIAFVLSLSFFLNQCFQNQSALRKLRNTENLHPWRHVDDVISFNFVRLKGQH